jgi:MFS family permease
VSSPTTGSADLKGTAPQAPETKVKSVIVACMLAVFLAMLDAQIVAAALPRIVADLGGLDVFAWVTTAYIISSSVTTPVYGKLGDLFGRKKVFLIAIALFLVGSSASGAAQSMEQLILFRVVQGIRASERAACSSPCSPSSARCSARAKAPSTSTSSGSSSPRPPSPDPRSAVY